MKGVKSYRLKPENAERVAKAATRRGVSEAHIIDECIEASDLKPFSERRILLEILRLLKDR